MASESPLDEVLWRSPAVAAQMGGIHTNTVLPYFAASPFFDRTSNNAVVTNQALYNPAMLYLVQTRAAFERHLASMAGLEFIVAHDPSRGDTVREHSGVWVIRKQMRRKRPGAEDECVPLAAYFVVGESVYMAPSLESVLRCRMLSTVDSLNKLVATASTLPIFTPALGHVYAHPCTKPVTGAAPAPAAPGSVAPTQTSDAGTTPQADAQSVSSIPRAERASSAAGKDARGARLLAESLSLLQRYGGEYMDESPLVGEPGSFRLERAKEGARPSPLRRRATQKEGEEAPAAVPAEEGKGDVAMEDAALAPAKARATGPPAPPAIKTDLASEVQRKIKGAEKTPITPGGGKRKKKSKVQTPKTPK